MRTPEIITEYNKKLKEDIKRIENNPDFYRKITQKTRDGERLTDSECIVCRRIKTTG